MNINNTIHLPNYFYPGNDSLALCFLLHKGWHFPALIEKWDFPSISEISTQIFSSSLTISIEKRRSTYNDGVAYRECKKNICKYIYIYTYEAFIFANSRARIRSFGEDREGATVTSFWRSRSILADSSLFISTWLCSVSNCVRVRTVSYLRSSSSKLNTSLSSYSFNWNYIE